MYTNYSNGMYPVMEDGRSFLLRKFFVLAAIAGIVIALVAFANEQQAVEAQAAARQSEENYRSLEQKYNDLNRQYAVAVENNGKIIQNLEVSRQAEKEKQAEIDRVTAERDQYKNALNDTNNALALTQSELNGLKEALAAEKQRASLSEGDLQTMSERAGDLERLVIEMSTATASLNVQVAQLKDEKNQMLRENQKAEAFAQSDEQIIMPVTGGSSFQMKPWLLLSFSAPILALVLVVRQTNRKKKRYIQVTAEELQWIKQNRRRAKRSVLPECGKTLDKGKVSL